jgi:hypothetical protein
MSAARLLATILLAPAAALAAGPPPAPGDPKQLGVAIRFAQYKTTFDYSGAPAADTTVKWIGVTWYERVAPRLELGLYGGYSFLTQTGNSVTAGIEPDGGHVGIALRGPLAETERLQLYLDGSYTYQKVDHAGATQSVALSWYEPQLRLGLAFTPPGRVRVYLGGVGSYLEGQQRVTGTAPATTNFERGRRRGGFLGLDLTVDRDGYIGLEARTGLERGGEIYFKKRF